MGGLVETLDDKDEEGLLILNCCQILYRYMKAVKACKNYDPY